jgi:ADP-heptose:LPS heptosyltransferase
MGFTFLEADAATAALNSIARRSKNGRSRPPRTRCVTRNGKRVKLCGAGLFKLMTMTEPLIRPTPFTNGRLMLCNVGRLGDTILRNSILDAAFRTYANVDYICGSDNVELVRNDSRLNEITIFDRSLSGWARIFKMAVCRRYDGFIALKDHRSSTSQLIARLFRSGVKTGWNSDHLHPFNRDVREVCAPNLHQTETMRRIGQLAGLDTGEYKPSLVLTADSVNWFRRNHDREEPYIFLNISATGADRVWPVEQWARYVRGCGLGDECVLINGMPKDRAMVNELCRKLPRAVAFQPRQFMDVAAAVSTARLVLTVDTGVVHACSALNTPVVAFYCAGITGTIYQPLSTRRLVIQARGIVAEMDPEEAIAETMRRGLP